MRSKRLSELPPYLFVEIDKLKREYIGSGGRALDLGIGDPDIAPDPVLTRYLREAVEGGKHNRYPHDRGLPLLVEAVRNWAGNLHGVPIGADEILITIGSKEAIGHLPIALINSNESVIVPDPGYPVYNAAAIFAGADSVPLPLLENNGFLPDFSGMERAVPEGTKLLFLNYPNNPTSATAGPDLFREAIELCRAKGIVLVNDAAYCDITYGVPAVPLFPLARDADLPYIEFFSFSKTFCITGWRVGFAIGSPEIIDALAAVKANLDSGVFGAIQEATARALDGHYMDITRKVTAVFKERRDILADGLEKGGFEFRVPEATFYFWIRTPDGMDSISYCKRLIERTGIIATPGVGFGARGEGYFRLSVTTDLETIGEAARRFAALGSGPI